MELKYSSQTGSENPEERHVNLLVLGSGPAGFAAALYAARAELEPILLTGFEFGGQAALTSTIENYPGFPDGVGGGQLGELFQKQAERFGAKVVYETASEVDLSVRPFRIVADSATYRADTLVIATGASSMHLNVPGEKELTGRGVSYCATCDGWFFKEKRVVVVGGGDSAIEEALFLTRYASSVTIVHRRDALRAGPLLQKRVFANEKVHIIWNSVVTEIVGDTTVKFVRLEDRVTGKTSEVDTDGVFVFIGHTPNTGLFNGQVEMDAKHYIVTDQLMHTSVPGVFAAGEVTDSTFRQVITSAGMGASAAMQAIKYLEETAQKESASV
jgi:thioredoxin reductase (NADPH)